MPRVANTSAAINPAGPPPMTATIGLVTMELLGEVGFAVMCCVVLLVGDGHHCDVTVADFTFFY